MATLSAHPITVVRGTDQLRAFGYRSRFLSQTGETVDGDLHHLIPLYLGGNHTIGNLFDLDPQAHRRIHEIIESLPIEETTLGPNQIGRLDLDFTEGVGILLRDGSIRIEPVAAYAMSTP